jgi:DNA mismatch repair protein MutS
MSTDPKTPMMSQWFDCKEKAKDALLFFRLGDFYEAFYEDAEILSKELELTLTKRQEIPMAGVPHFTIDTQIDKLISRGFKVAIAEQIEDPKTTKGLVKRDVVKIVSPGALIESSLLLDHSNNFIVSLSQVGTLFGLAALDLSTAEFITTEYEKESDLMNELFRLRPKEIIVSKRFFSKHPPFFEELKNSFNPLINTKEDWHFEHQVATDVLQKHFEIFQLSGFGLEGKVASINASGALIQYLKQELCQNLSHVKSITPYFPQEFMQIDRNTLRHLELTEGLFGKKNTLLKTLDFTETPMGARLLASWIKQPLLSKETISKRQDAIEEFLKEGHLKSFRELLDGVRDLQRLISKVVSQTANPKDLVALKDSLERLPFIINHLKEFKSELIRFLTQSITPLPHLTKILREALVDEPPLRITDGGVIREGFSEELDSLRNLEKEGQTFLLDYQENLRQQTGIKTLKVNFTRAFGYYIEVSKGQSHLMPASFQRRQTLVNAERFISPELKIHENKLYSAEEKISAIEKELFSSLKEKTALYEEPIKKTAKALAELDVLQSLSFAAKEYNYSRPLIDDSLDLIIEEGRHPVIELVSREPFVSNNTDLNEKNRLMMITGPNMAGKSTYIRQVALIVLLAQIGSFVPAKRAKLGILDKLFTRIGASDDLSRGQSTFMVEMMETANILNNASDRSLVILDEIGRGTSTYDGISIAWSVAEYLLTTQGKQAKTLFATHYFELTQLAETLEGAKNYKVAIQETEQTILFLRKIIPGDTDKSYGIHVAKLAGIPIDVLSRSQEILSHLEETYLKKNLFQPTKLKRKIKPFSPQKEVQLTLFN